MQQVPHPFNLSHLSAALSQPGPVQTPVVPAMAPQAHHNMQADWERFRAQSQRGSPQPQLAPAPAQSAWASDFSQGKGKAREMPQQHMEPMMHTPQMMPPNPFGGMGMMQQYQPRLSPMYTQAPPVAADHAKMEAAFEAALADARAQSVPQEKEAEPETKTDEAKTEEAKTEEPKAEEERPFKGDLEAVWESLKPEAERQNKLAEWEAEFSQVCPSYVREDKLTSSSLTAKMMTLMSCRGSLSVTTWARRRSTIRWSSALDDGWTRE